MQKVRDYYFKKAKQDNYPARSVYKLEEIDKKYRFFKKGKKVLDIGCSPGSWSRYIIKKIGNGRVIGIDTSGNIQIQDDRFTFLHADIFKIEPELLKLDNVVLQPHSASATIETRTKMAVMAAENVIVGLNGEKPPNCVNNNIFS